PPPFQFFARFQTARTSPSDLRLRRRFLQKLHLFLLYPAHPFSPIENPANSGGDDVKTRRNCRRRRRRFRPSRAAPSLGTGTPTTHTQQAGPSQGQAAWDYL
ncbi:hypothetical protein Prudu_006113, partial [Prunus dulcis]